MGFFDSKERSATAKAVSDIEVIEISFEKLKPVYKQYPDYFKTIISSIVERLRTANNRIKFLEQESSAIDYSGKSEEHKLINEHSMLKVATLLSFLLEKHGVKMDEGVQIKNGELRKYGLRVFGIPMVRIMAGIDALQKASFLDIINDEEGNSKIYLKSVSELDNYIQWLNEEILKLEKNRIRLNTTSLEAMKFLTIYGDNGSEVEYKVKNPKDPDEWLIQNVWQLNIVPHKAEALEKHGISINDSSFKTLISLGLVAENVAESLEKVYVRYDRDKIDSLYPSYKLQFFINYVSDAAALSEGKEKEQDSKNEYRK
jgi:uncharacterized small protein (DUF1192 family)